MKRRIVAAALAAVLAAVGFFAVLAYAKSADARAVAGKKAVTVLVATKHIPAGTTGDQVRTGGYVEAVPMPASAVPGDALDKVDDSLATLVLTADLQPRQLVLRGAFGELAKTTGGLPLPEGKLAVSVELKVAEQVAGYVQPGAKVAIFDTFTIMEGKGRVPAGDGLATGHDLDQATRVLLPRVEVIAVGQYTAAAADATAASSDTKADKAGSVLVTVAVNQDEAERLIHGSRTGALYLALLDSAATVKPGPGVDNYTLIP